MADELNFLDEEEHQTPITKEPMISRLIRIETRMVKYQESNSMQMGELMDVVNDMAEAMQEIVYLLQELQEEGMSGSKES